MATNRHCSTGAINDITSTHTSTSHPLVPARWVAFALVDVTSSSLAIIAAYAAKGLSCVSWRTVASSTPESLNFGRNFSVK